MRPHHERLETTQTDLHEIDTLTDALAGCQWAASCGVEAAPYFRIFNHTRQAGIVAPKACFVEHEISGSEPDRSSEPIVDLAASYKRVLGMFKDTHDKWKTRTSQFLIRCQLK